MDSASSSGGSTDAAAAVYETAMVRRSLDQQRLQGAQAVQLIEGATPPTPSSRAPAALPPDATFSVRV